MDLLLIQDYVFTLHKNKYIRYLLFLVCCALLGLTIWGAYAYFEAKKVEEAQKAFSQALTEFEKNVQAERAMQHWEEVISAFDAGYQKYGGTPFAPYFLAYKAQSLLYANKPEAALEVTAHVVNGAKKSSPLYYLYATKLALMKIDGVDQAMREQGLGDLENLASDIKNPQRDWAAYELGAYFLAVGNKGRANQVWAQLAARGGSNSVWAISAQRQLALVTRV